MLHLTFQKHVSVFRQPGGTSRGVLHTKDSWILYLEDESRPGKRGLGEVSIIENLSPDDPGEIEQQLTWLCGNIDEDQVSLYEKLENFPAIRFGLETALLSLEGQDGILFDTPFTRGERPIPINGLVWMGDHDFMRRQLTEKIEQGFRCIKLKIGAIDFEMEIDLLQRIRKDFPPGEMEIRVDANGAFSPAEAPAKLEQLSAFHLHSIEQPIRQGQWKEMAAICRAGLVPVALDEELIGITGIQKMEELLDTIGPRYIILKPSLLGGLEASDTWIRLAEERGIGWWATSALETNIGLNAIAQWVSTKNTTMPQGLGTGQLFTNNFDAPLVVKNGNLHYLANHK
jgi:O-succinylbenzoate synthase